MAECFPWKASWCRNEQRMKWKAQGCPKDWIFSLATNLISLSKTPITFLLYIFILHNYNTEINVIRSVVPSDGNNQTMPKSRLSRLRGVAPQFVAHTGVYNSTFHCDDYDWLRGIRITNKLTKQQFL